MFVVAGQYYSDWSRPHQRLETDHPPAEREDEHGQDHRLAGNGAPELSHPSNPLSLSLD